MVDLDSLTLADVDYATVEFRSEIERTRRDGLLKQTDWWAMSDLTMTAEQTAYRQALRDVPDQAGFPTNIAWPTKP